MKLRELLSELRRNPEINKEKQGHAGALQFLQSISKYEIDSYGISMTNIQKIGINPKSTHHTPIGIYFYPAFYYIEKKKNNEPLEYQDDASYIQILKFSGEQLDLTSFSQSDYDYYFSMMLEKSDQIGKIIGQSGENASKMISKYHYDSSFESLSKTPGGKFWYMTWKLSEADKSMNRVSIAPRSSVAWNSILRLLNIDVILDFGGKIIHINEPTQGVVLDPNKVKLVKTFINLTSKTPDKTPGDSFANFLKNLDLWNPSEYIKNLSYQINKIDKNTKWKYKNNISQAANKFKQILDKNPSLYIETDPTSIRNLASGDPELLEYLEINYYKNLLDYYKDDLKNDLEFVHDSYELEAKRIIEVKKVMKFYWEKFDGLKNYPNNSTAISIIKFFKDISTKYINI